MSKCPRCGVDNSSESAVCQNCQTLLQAQPKGPAMPQGGPRLTGQGTPPVSPNGMQQPTPQMRTGPQPLAGYQEGFNGQPQGMYNPPPPTLYRREEFAARKSSSAGSWVVGIIVLFAVVVGGYFIWKTALQKNTPVGIVRRMSHAADLGNFETARKCVTKDTVIDPTSRYSLISAMTSGKNRDLVGLVSSEGINYTIELKSENNMSAQVVIKFTDRGMEKFMEGAKSSFGAANRPDIREKAFRIMREGFSSGFIMFCTKEDGAWKVDGPKTDAGFQDMLRQMMCRMVFEVSGRQPSPALLQQFGLPPAPASSGSTVMPK